MAAADGFYVLLSVVCILWGAMSARVFLPGWRPTPTPDHMVPIIRWVGLVVGVVCILVGLRLITIILVGP